MRICLTQAIKMSSVSLHYIGESAITSQSYIAKTYHSLSLSLSLSLFSLSLSLSLSLCLSLCECVYLCTYVYTAQPIGWQCILISIECSGCSINRPFPFFCSEPFNKSLYAGHVLTIYSNGQMIKQWPQHWAVHNHCVECNL